MSPSCQATPNAAGNRQIRLSTINWRINLEPARARAARTANSFSAWLLREAKVSLIAR